jgi:hypothetical protein
MKALYLSGLISFLSASSFSQQNNNAQDQYPRWQITTGIGLIGMTSLPSASGIDQQISLGAKLDATYNLQLSGKHYLSMGLGFESNRHIVDGFFIKSVGQYNFSITPPNYKQHEMSLNFLNVPILYKYRWLNTSSVSIGPYAGYLISSNSKYKIDIDKFEADAPVEIKFRWGLQGEWEVFNFYNTKHKTGSVLGMGVQYQISNYLDEGRSFKPLFAYFKFGIAIK